MSYENVPVTDYLDVQNDFNKSHGDYSLRMNDKIREKVTFNSKESNFIQLNFFIYIKLI